MDKRTEKGEETKALVLEQAIVMIAEEGIGALSASRLAQRAGISKGNLFHHFKTTDAILLAVAETVMAASSQILLVEGDSVEAYLKAMASGLLDMSKQDQLLFRAYFAVYNHGLFNQSFNALIRHQTSQLLMQLNEQIKRRHLQTVTVNKCSSMTEETYRHCSAHFLAFMDGLGLQVLLEQSGDPQNYSQLINLEVACILSALNNLDQ